MARARLRVLPSGERFHASQDAGRSRREDLHGTPGRSAPVHESRLPRSLEAGSLTSRPLPGDVPPDARLRQRAPKCALLHLDVSPKRAARGTLLNRPHNPTEGSMRKFLSAVFTAFLCAGVAQAGLFTQFVVFGDSLDRKSTRLNSSHLGIS